MSNAQTPGQVAYAAFWRVLSPRYGHPLTPYGGLTALQVKAWEAAAQAVLDDAEFPPLDLRLEDETP